MCGVLLLAGLVTLSRLSLCFIKKYGFKAMLGGSVIKSKHPYDFLRGTEQRQNS